MQGTGYRGGVRYNATVFLVVPVGADVDIAIDNICVIVSQSTRMLL